MALRSMTGFGRAQAHAHGWDFSLEIRSVNHKGLDIKVSVPNFMSGAESTLQKSMRPHLHRGRVSATLRAQRALSGGEGSSAELFDLDAAGKIFEALDGLRASLGIEAPVQLEQVLAFEGVKRSVDNAFDLEATADTLETLAIEATGALVEERDREGAALTEDFLMRLGRLSAHIDTIETEVPAARERHFARLKERLSDTLERYALGTINDERLWQEVIIYADRSDITEEITRARAHVGMLIKLIEGFTPGVDGAVGKKLDFYFQELIRETNTMGSKSQSEAIAVCVVENRSEIDRMREQVLNVE